MHMEVSTSTNIMDISSEEILDKEKDNSSGTLIYQNILYFTKK